MRLEGKSIVVTGASSGMGKAMVETFVKEGAHVVGVARSEDKLLKIKESLKDQPGKMEIFDGDVSKKEDTEAMIDFAVEKFGHLDILVNNAGIMDDMSGVGNLSDEMYEKVFAVNVYGLMSGMRKAVQVFKDQGNGGNIINIASVGAFKTVAGAVYAASKAAVVSLTKNTAFMYVPDNIRVNAIAPGGIETNIASSMGQPNVEGYERTKLASSTMPGMGQAQDVAELALFLASDKSKFVNGQVIAVDGGWMAG